MTAGIEKLKEQLRKAEAARKKAVRQAQLLSFKLGKQERRDDTRRKIIDGAHMQTESLRDPVIAALLHKRRDENLTRDDDRALFNLAPLDDAVKLEREGFVAPRRGRPAKMSSREVAALADTVAELVAGAAAVGALGSEPSRANEAA